MANAAISALSRMNNMSKTPEFYEPITYRIQTPTKPVTTCNLNTPKSDVQSPYTHIETSNASKNVLHTPFNQSTPLHIPTATMVPLSSSSNKNSENKSMHYHTSNIMEG